MTSISATSGSAYLSPLQQLQAELQSEVNSGAISSSDQSALSAALTDINSSLQAGSASNPGGGTNSPPGDLKTKIDNLIAGEVSSGKLTSAQATELQGVFQAAFAGGPADSSGAGGTARPRLPVRRPRRGRLRAAHRAARMAPITVIMAATAVRPRPTVHPRPAARAVRRTPAPPTIFCSNFCSRCRIRCRVRRRIRTARPAVPTAVRPSRRF